MKTLCALFALLAVGLGATDADAAGTSEGPESGNCFPYPLSEYEDDFECNTTSADWAAYQFSQLASVEDKLHSLNTPSALGANGCTTDDPSGCYMSVWYQTAATFEAWDDVKTIVSSYYAQVDGADIDVASGIDGMTVLHTAAMYGETEVALFLLENGASPTRKALHPDDEDEANPRNLTAAEFARAFNFSETADAIDGYGNDADEEGPESGNDADEEGPESGNDAGEEGPESGNGSNDGNDSNVGAIVGGTIGGICVVLGAALLVVGPKKVLQRFSKKKTPSRTPYNINV